MGRKPASASRRVLQLLKREKLMSSAQAEAHGATRATLSRLVQDGALQRVARGLYAVADADLDGRNSLVVVQRRIPKGVICLISALDLHGLTTQIPNQVWVMVPHKSWRSNLEYPAVQLVYSSEVALAHGTTLRKIDGQSVRVTTAAKTVADCFKYRSKVGLDVAIAALRDFLRQRGRSMDELWQAAEVDRVTSIMKPYAEALA